MKASRKVWRRCLRACRKSLWRGECLLPLLRITVIARRYWDWWVLLALLRVIVTVSLYYHYTPLWLSFLRFGCRRNSLVFIGMSWLSLSCFTEIATRVRG